MTLSRFLLPRMLVDAVQSSKFITQRKSSELIRKLESQASVHQARQLQRQVYVDRRVKSMNFWKKRCWNLPAVNLPGLETRLEFYGPAEKVI